MWSAYRVFLIYSFTTALGLTIAYTVNMVYLVEVLRLDPLQMILVGTVLETTAFLFEIPTGVVADTYSRRLSVIIGVFLLGLGQLIFAAISLFGVILLSQVVLAIGYTFISGADSAWITDEIGEAAAQKAYLRASQVGSAAGIVGIIISVGLAMIDLRLPILLGGVTLILLMGLLWFVMPENGFSPTPKEERETFKAMRETTRQSVQVIRRRPVLITILLIAFVFGAYSESFDRLWTLHILESFSLPQLGEFDSVIWFGVIGIVSSLLGIFVTEVVQRRVEQEAHIVRVLMWTNGIIILGGLVFAVTSSFGLALVAFWIIGVMRGLNYPLRMAWINQGLDSRVRATVISMSSQADAIGQIAGGPAIGFIGRLSGVRVTLVIGSVLLAPALILYRRTLRPASQEAAVST